MKDLPRGPLTLKFTEKATKEADGWALGRGRQTESGIRSFGHFHPDQPRHQPWEVGATITIPISQIRKWGLERKELMQVAAVELGPEPCFVGPGLRYLVPVLRYNNNWGSQVVYWSSLIHYIVIASIIPLLDLGRTCDLFPTNRIW